MRVEFFAYIRDYTGCRATEIAEAASVRDAARILCGLYGLEFREALLAPDGDLGSKVIVMVNGRHVFHTGGIDTPLKEGDKLQIFAKVAGG